MSRTLRKTRRSANKQRESLVTLFGFKGSRLLLVTNNEFKGRSLFEDMIGSRIVVISGRDPTSWVGGDALHGAIDGICCRTSSNIDLHVDN